MPSRIFGKTMYTSLDLTLRLTGHAICDKGWEISVFSELVERIEYYNICEDTILLSLISSTKYAKSCKISLPTNRFYFILKIVWDTECPMSSRNVNEYTQEQHVSTFKMISHLNQTTLVPLVPPNLAFLHTFFLLFK